MSRSIGGGATHAPPVLECLVSFSYFDAAADQSQFYFSLLNSSTTSQTCCQTENLTLAQNAHPPRPCNVQRGDKSPKAISADHAPVASFRHLLIYL